MEHKTFGNVRRSYNHTNSGYKTLDCDTSWLGHDERSEEGANRTSVTVRLIKRVYYNILRVVILHTFIALI
jgi:hypothetical protein